MCTRTPVIALPHLMSLTYPSTRPPLLLPPPLLNAPSLSNPKDELPIRLFGTLLPCLLPPAAETSNSKPLKDHLARVVLPTVDPECSHHCMFHGVKAPSPFHSTPPLNNASTARRPKRALPRRIRLPFSVHRLRCPRLRQPQLGRLRWHPPLRVQPLDPSRRLPRRRQLHHHPA